MSYKIRDNTKVEAWRVWFSLSNGERVMVERGWEPSKKDLAEIEAARLHEGKVVPRYGWKTVETVYPTCPKCGHQGKSTGEQDHPYNGGGRYYKCLNPECNHGWCWS
jgi:hypothetical protein